MGAIEVSYSEVADAQLDELEAGDDAQLYNDVLETCTRIGADPASAQSRSSAIQTEHGIRFSLAVRGHPSYKVFWSPDGPRIEALFKYP